MPIAYDSVTGTDIPLEHQGSPPVDAVQGYNGPGFVWLQEWWDRFPDIPKWHTALSTNIDGDELDIENGAVSPGDRDGIVTWVTNNPRPKVSLYTNHSTYPQVRGYIEGAGLSGKVVYRIAAWSGVAALLGEPGEWGCQYANPTFSGGHFDLTYYEDLSWLDPSFIPQPSAPVATILVMGMKGNDVSALQLSLNAVGYALTVDGDFGVLTDQAVRAFQRTQGLVEDGQAGPDTMGALAAAANSIPVDPTAFGPAQPPNVPAGTTRDAIVAVAQSQVGQFGGQGYNNPNRYSEELGLPTEAWCADFITWLFLTKGSPLPSMQTGHTTGFSYVQSGLNYAIAQGASRPSWLAEPADSICFKWAGDSSPGDCDHVEIMVRREGDTLVTIGGNSGPNGGVNEHRWYCPQGVGNALIRSTINAAMLADLGAVPVAGPPPGVIAPTPAGATGPVWPGRLLMLKSPHMLGVDVTQFQERLIQFHYDLGPTGADGDFGPFTNSATLQFQAARGLTQDGQVGPITWAAVMGRIEP